MFKEGMSEREKLVGCTVGSKGRLAYILCMRVDNNNGSSKNKHKIN